MSDLTKKWFEHFEECPARELQFPNVKAQIDIAKMDVAGVGSDLPTLQTPGSQILLLAFALRGYDEWASLLERDEAQTLYRIADKLLTAYNAQRKQQPGMQPIIMELRRQGVM